MSRTETVDKLRRRDDTSAESFTYFQSIHAVPRVKVVKTNGNKKEDRWNLMSSNIQALLDLVSEVY